MAKNSVTPSNILTKEEAEEQIKTTLTGIQNIESTVSAGIFNILEDKIPGIIIGQCDSINGNINIKYRIKNDTKRKIYKFKISISDILDAKKKYQETRNWQAIAERKQAIEEAAKRRAEEEEEKKAQEQRIKEMHDRQKKEKREARQNRSPVPQIVKGIEKFFGESGYLAIENKTYLKKIMEQFYKQRNEKHPSEAFPLQNINSQQGLVVKEIASTLVDRLCDIWPFKMLFLQGEEYTNNYVYICSKKYYHKITKYCKNHSIDKLTIDTIPSIFEQCGNDLCSDK